MGCHSSPSLPLSLSDLSLSLQCAVHVHGVTDVNQIAQTVEMVVQPDLKVRRTAQLCSLSTALHATAPSGLQRCLALFDSSLLLASRFSLLLVQTN